jgi:hypothetical protein
MSKKEAIRQIKCDPATFAECRKDKKFAFIVALARSANALAASHSLLLNTLGVLEADAIRDRINGFFFASAVLYEAINLIGKMKPLFADDKTFEGGLLRLRDDPTTQDLYKNHLNRARNRAVFHFLPEKLAHEIEKAKPHECVFIEAHGPQILHTHYAYADLVAAGIFVGLSTTSDGFSAALNEVLEKVGRVMTDFITESEPLIGNYLLEWGFKRTVTDHPASPQSPSQE